MLETAILFLVFVIFLYLWINKRPSNYPPGPTPLPFIGNMHQLPKKGHLWQLLQEWTKLYGPIIGVSIANRLVVFVTGADNVIAALRKEEFQSRPDVFSIRARSFGKCLGIFFSHGDQWTSTRKFVVKNMRAYGKSEKENVISDEIDRLMDTINDGIMQGTGIFGLSAVNVIWTMIANKRIDSSDEKSRRFLKNLYELFRRGKPSGGNLVDISPIFRFVSSDFKFSQSVIKEAQDYIRETIQEHRAVLDPNNPMDLIDHYLVEMERNGGKSYFTEEDLIMVGNDLFTAGAESTSNSIEFVLLYMILFPDIQQKMQQELDEVLGRSRKPNLDDKTKMHYTMAVLSEVERINSVAPTNVPHACTKDTTFAGYCIPKGTMISMDLRSLGYDTKYWKTPNEFMPERFLQDGKYIKPAILATFGLGQRACVGEVFARNTIFLFTTTFFEKFSISLPPGEPKPSTLALPGFTTAPQPFKILVKSRY